MILVLLEWLGVELLMGVVELVTFSCIYLMGIFVSQSAVGAGGGADQKDDD